MAKKWRQYRKHSSRKRNTTQDIVLFLALVVGLWIVGYVGSSPHMPLMLLGGIGLLISLPLIAIIFLQARRRDARNRALKLADIDGMTGREFEEYMVPVIKHKGYKNVRLTPASQDFGVDIFFEDKEYLYGAQLKRYTSQVGVDAVYQAIGGAAFYNCDKAVVITNSSFTPAAIHLGTQTNTWLIPRETLAEWVREYQERRIENKKQITENSSAEQNENRERRTESSSR